MLQVTVNIVGISEADQCHWLFCYFLLCLTSLAFGDESLLPYRSVPLGIIETKRP